MKKMLLSSIMMLGVCGIAAAQTDSKSAKLKQPASATTSAAAPTPQKAAVVSENDLGTTPVAEKEADAASARSATQTAQKAEATSVNAGGEVVPNNDAKRKEAKMAAVKAANAQASGKQN